MPLQSSILCTIPVIILENIALEVALNDPVGLPSDIIPLLQTCRHVYNTLSTQSCPNLYACIFRCKFDTTAACRRFGVRATYSSNLAVQLRKYCQTLQAIRRGDIYSDSLLDTFWVTFIMLTENDGKNYQQLQWAGADTMAVSYVRSRLWEGRENVNGWPPESTTNCLALWIMWLMTDIDKLRAEPAEVRKNIMHLVRPYVFIAARYPSFHAPDNHFNVPLDEQLRRQFPYTLMTPHGFYPLYRQPESVVEHLIHYNLRVDIAPPPITIAAKQLYFIRTQLFPLGIPPTLPVDRAAALELGINQGPTQADLQEVNRSKPARITDKGDFDWKCSLSPEELEEEENGVWKKGLKAVSAQWDNDWHRYTWCYDPWQSFELKGVVYTYGTLGGLWEGRMMMPDLNQYFGIVTSTAFPENFSDMYPHAVTSPFFMRLREHHCINPEIPVETGGVRDGFDEGVRNGWFPTAATFRENGGIVRVESPHGHVSRYETYVEGQPNSHSEDTCTLCRHRIMQEEEEMRVRVRENARFSSGGESAFSRRASSSSGMEDSTEVVVEMRRTVQAQIGSNTDVDDVLDLVMDNVGDACRASDSVHDDTDSELDYVENTCKGIQDIIVTGETLPRHGAAWHNYHFYGRIRHWDGLIALVRVPVNIAELGTFIFRGYVVGNRNLVGSWRTFTHNVQAIPYEGPFIASKADVQDV